MVILMHLYEGFDVYYVLIYSHNTYAADTNAAPFTNESTALIVQVRLKRSGPEPPITSHEFSRVSSFSFTLDHTNGAC